MNILFIHPNFPGQFRYLAEFFGKDEKNKTVFITSATASRALEIKGVKKIILAEKAREDEKKLTPLKSPPAVPVANLLHDLKEKKGFIPDLVMGHSGSGMTLYVKDVFPDAAFISSFEWFHSPGRLQQEFKQESSTDLKMSMNLRNKNLPILSDLSACDVGICPTKWQKKQFPDDFSGKLKIIHHGIDTGRFCPVEKQTFKTEELDLSNAKQIITYTTNLLAPYMGFEQFMEAIPNLLEQKSDTHVVIVGFDRVTFGNQEGDRKTYKDVIKKKLGLSSERVHFIDALPQKDYIRLLQASSAHVYLDSPLVVSRQMLEAMACGCLVIAPDTPPVKEIIKNGNNGFLVDFSLPDKITEKLIGCLEYPSFMASVQQKARETIQKDFSLKKQVQLQLKIIKSLISKEDGQQFG